MIAKYNGTVDAVQVTQTMMDGSEECPMHATRMQDTFGGAPVGDPKILFMDPNLSPRMYVHVGDWLVYGPFGNRVLSDADFKKFFG